MNLAIYFTRPGDTRIAAENPAFIERLEEAGTRRDRVRVTKDPATADVVLVDERYQYRTWHYADELAQCIFVRRHADRILVINHDDHARPLLPGLYVSLEKHRPPLVHARPVPYKRDLWRLPVPKAFDYRPTGLFAFRGTFHSHPVRKRMCRVLSKDPRGRCEELRKAFHTHDASDQLSYLEDIRNARFSLCPRGLSPSTYRLYETMQLGRCPVVISDAWVAPEGPEWGTFSLIVAESNVEQLPEILAREIEHAEARSRFAHQAWKEFFSWPRRWSYFLEQVVRLKESESLNLGFAELHDLWVSREFRRQYQWTMAGRAKQLVARKCRALTSSRPPEANS